MWRSLTDGCFSSPPARGPCNERCAGCARERSVLWALPGLKGSSHRNPGIARRATTHTADGDPGEDTAAALLGLTGVTWWQDEDPIKTRSDGPHLQAHPRGPRGARFRQILARRSFLGAAGTVHGAACSWLSAQARGSREGTAGAASRAPSQQPSHRFEDEPAARTALVSVMGAGGSTLAALAPQMRRGHGDPHFSAASLGSGRGGLW